MHFKETTLNTLVDSPVYAGSHFKRVDLSTDAANQVFLDVFGDKEADLAITPEELTVHKNLVAEAKKLYGSHHYSHYDFLFSVSDRVGGIGLEHHQSSEDGEGANYFTNWAAGVPERDLLAHEYTHSWDGKFRRPADLWTPNYNVPMRDSLLWVYEGMTEYLGFVLTARSGMNTAAQQRDLIAMIAADYDISPGRKWRPLEDTTNQPTISTRTPVSWVSWQRPEDYYMEGLLIWLDADTKIREMSGGKKSLDDFAKIFYGIDNGSYVTRTYTFDDLVHALNQTQPYDWADLPAPARRRARPRNSERRSYPRRLPPRLQRHASRLVESRGRRRRGASRGRRRPRRRSKTTDFSTSLGFSVNSEGESRQRLVGQPRLQGRHHARRQAGRASRTAPSACRRFTRSSRRSRKQQGTDPPAGEAQRGIQDDRCRLPRWPALPETRAHRRQARAARRHPRACEVIV